MSSVPAEDSQWGGGCRLPDRFVGRSAASAAASSSTVVGSGCLPVQVINLKCPIINNRGAMTCSESPFLTAATSCYSTNAMIDIICTVVATGHYIQNKPQHAEANYTNLSC